MIKQVILIRRDLGMRRGKECAQVAHASSMWLTKHCGSADDNKFFIFCFAYSIVCISLMIFVSMDAALNAMVWGVPLAVHFALRWLTPVPLSNEEKEWLHGTFTKVVLQVEDEEDLEYFYEAAKKKGLTAYLVVDSGKTEFHGRPTKTAVAIGPNKSEDIDAVTGHLKLY